MNWENVLLLCFIRKGIGVLRNKCNEYKNNVRYVLTYVNKLKSR